MNWILELDLLSGPLPVAISLLGAAALGFLLARKSGRWLLFAAASAAAAFLLAWIACWAAIHVFFFWSEDLPLRVVAVVALVLWAVALGGTTALAGVRRRGTRRRAAATAPAAPWPSPSPAPTLRRRILALLSTAVIFLTAATALNVMYGDTPTVGALLGRHPQAIEEPPPALQHAGAPMFMGTAVAARWQAPPGLPAEGRVLSVPIPGTESGLAARNAVVYLPPAYAAARRPILPVLVLVAGQPGSPESWLRSTSLVHQLDAFAAAHGGLAPLVVIPDPNGSDNANTMCMDSALGLADTYMAVDVPAWIKSHLDADSNPAHWAVGGFSYGGTCSLQMATRHPELFHTFMAMSPEREPALAVQRSVTVDRAFQGDAAAFDAQLPLTWLAEHKYPQTHGWFAAGAQDATYSANVKTLRAAADAAGMTTAGASFPGGHTWAVASEALPQGFRFVFPRLGLS